jgi:hypothetical protein
VIPSLRGGRAPLHLSRLRGSIGRLWRPSLERRTPKRSFGYGARQSAAGGGKLPPPKKLLWSGTPTPTLPRKRERERITVAAALCADLRPDTARRDAGVRRPLRGLLAMRAFSILCAPICPTGKSVVFGSSAVQPPLQKYFRSGLTQIRCISIAVSFRQEGRFAIVTNAGRDAVDARAPGAQWQSQGEMNLVSGQRRAR